MPRLETIPRGSQPTVSELCQNPILLACLRLLFEREQISPPGGWLQKSTLLRSDARLLESTLLRQAQLFLDRIPGTILTAYKLCIFAEAVTRTGSPYPDVKNGARSLRTAAPGPVGAVQGTPSGKSTQCLHVELSATLRS